jgi:putative phosphoribosyl transferase
MVFRDRVHAGRELAQELLRYRDKEPVVLALPRGGVPVAFEIARALAAPLDLVLVRKIGAPGHSEFAIGAVADGGHPEIVVHDDIIDRLAIPKTYIEVEAARQLAEIERRRQVYLAGHPPVDVTGRTVIVVDDGIATGATVEAALRSVRHNCPARIVLAAPVAAPDTVEALRPLADDIVCLQLPRELGAVSLHYLDFPQVTDAEVIDLLRRAHAAGSAVPAAGPPHA